VGKRLPKHPQTGCRFGQLDGEWAIDPARLEPLAAVVMAEIDRQGLKALAEASASEAEHAPEPVTLDTDTGIARASLSGVLTKYPTSVSAVTGGTAMLPLARAVRQAAADPRVKAMWVEGDSPGGTVLGTPELYAAFRAFASAGKPLRFHATGEANSGAFWLALAADRITADPAATVGSVGGVMRLSDVSEQAKRAGVAVEYVATGERKAIGAPGKPVTDADRAEVRRYLDDMVRPFIAALDERRPGLSPEVRADVLKAGVYEASTAARIGLIDGVAFADDAYAAFCQQVKDGTAGQHRGRSGGASSTTHPPAAGSELPMALTNDELAQARKIPGLENATADTAIGVVLAAAVQATAQARDTVAGLTNEVADLKKKLPQPADPALAAGHVDLAVAKIEHLRDAGRCLPAQCEALVAALRPDGKADPAAFAPGRGVVIPAEAVANAFALNAPKLPLGSQTSDQRVNVTAPPKIEAGGGAKQDDAALLAEGQAAAAAYQKQQLDARGIRVA
jgi:signal peptide peptidase SppA